MVTHIFKTKIRFMKLGDYQTKASETNQFSDGERSMASSIWNLTESVSLISRLYDERARLIDMDEEKYREKMKSKLGDILWYVSNTSSNLSFKLEEIAQDNLQKCQDRWGKKKKAIKHFDEKCPPDQQLPRKIKVKIDQDENGRVKMSVELKDGGEMALGARVTDNAHFEDGYRFHDVIHLSFMTVLGWSPVMRALMNRKRKGEPKIDEVEDGARAINLEEAVSAMIYEYARSVEYFKDEKHVPFELLKLIEKITRGLEISSVTYDLWNDAIIQGYAAWRETFKNNGGIIDCDLCKRQIKYRTFDEIK
jgi:NTP pyrophosphatase (non-canonical NTP hydrolase)